MDISQSVEVQEMYNLFLHFIYPGLDTGMELFIYVNSPIEERGYVCKRIM